MDPNQLQAYVALLSNLLDMWRAFGRSKGLTSEQIDQVEAASVSDSAKRATEREAMGRSDG